MNFNFSKLIDRRCGNSKYLLWGSANPNLVFYSTESLAGRLIFTELTPLNFLEAQKNVNIKNHWFGGDFPRALLAKNITLRIKWLNSFITTYVERDFRFIGLNAQPATLRRLWTMIAGVQGSILNMNSLANSMVLSAPTILKYLDFLEGAFIIHRLQPFYINIKKRLVKSPKLYIRDSGVLHRLLNIPSYSDLIGNLISGGSWEGYVVEQIYQLTKNNFGLYYYRTQTGVEIDLVLARGLTPIAAVEIKFSVGPSLTKGNYTAIDDVGAKQNFVIGFDVEDYPIRKDIRVCSLNRFLKHYLPKL